ncbi:hypothetical protein D3C79_944440 [compost metagenome]
MYCQGDQADIAVVHSGDAKSQGSAQRVDSQLLAYQILECLVHAGGLCKQSGEGIAMIFPALVGIEQRGAVAGFGWNEIYRGKGQGFEGFWRVAHGSIPNVK